MAESSILIRSRIKKAQNLLQRNKLGEAAYLYEQLCKSRPKDIEYRLTLAIIYRRLGKFKKAEEICRHALLLQGNNAQAHHVSGSIQQCLGNLDGAIASYNTAIRLDPELAETHYFLGNALQLSGQTRDAAESYRKAIQHQPSFLEALSNLGAVLIALHQFGEARTVLEKASRLSPSQVQILCNLGDLSLMEDDTGQAMDYAKSALHINPQFLDAHYLMGRAYRKKGEYTQALDHFRDALKLQPDNENVIGSAAELLEIRGDFNAAQNLIAPLVQRETHNPLVLWAYSALARHYNNERKAATLIENALGKGGIETSHMIKLHSELGKQYDHLKEYPRAFEHYRQANQLEQKLNGTLRTNAGAGFTTEETVNQWFTEYGSDFWLHLPHSGATSNRPIFIIGMPRSGTTLAEQILSSHPSIHGAGELPDIAELANQLGDNGRGNNRFRYLANMDKRALSVAATKYLGTLEKQYTDASRVVDKMPTNFWHLGVISLLFPHAHIIHMMRDPRDVCASMYFQQFGATMTFTTDLRELAAYYSAYAAIMHFWKKVLDIQIMDVQYEDLVADQETLIRKMVDFCRLEWSDSCLQFYMTARDVNTPSYDQVRQPMYSKSVGRWKHYEKQLTPLIEALNPEQYQ